MWGKLDKGNLIRLADSVSKAQGIGKIGTLKLVAVKDGKENELQLTLSMVGF